jgi:hypothetical protein
LAKTFADVALLAAQLEGGQHNCMALSVDNLAKGLENL